MALSGNGGLRFWFFLMYIAVFSESLKITKIFGAHVLGRVISFGKIKVKK